MGDVNINNLIKLYTLCLLNNGPMHGYEIIKKLENRMDRNVSTSQVYPFLKTLRNKEIIDCCERGGRDRKSYSLTIKGEEFVESVFGRFENLINSVIEKKLSSCDNCGCTLFGSGHEESISGELKMFCCSHCAEDYLKSDNHEEELIVR